MRAAQDCSWGERRFESGHSRAASGTAACLCVPCQRGAGLTLPVPLDNLVGQPPNLRPPPQSLQPKGSWFNPDKLTWRKVEAWQPPQE